MDHGCVTDYVWVMIWISSDKSCKVPVKSSPINQHPTFYRPDALPVAQPTVSKDSREKYHIPWTCLPPMSLRGFPTLSLTTKGSWLPWGGLPCPSPRQPGAFRSRSGSMIFSGTSQNCKMGSFRGFVLSEHTSSRQIYFILIGLSFLADRITYTIGHLLFADPGGRAIVLRPRTVSYPASYNDISRNA